jgi:hypothetical protein
MDSHAIWKYVSHLNIFQAALLMMGIDPSGSREKQFSEWSPELRLRADPYLTMLRTAIETGKLEPDKIAHITDAYDPEDIDWQETLIEAKRIGDWMRSINFSNAFFTPDIPTNDPILDRHSEFYAPKLAAAVTAWREVTSDEGKWIATSPKKAIRRWLYDHAAEFGLLNDEGKPIEQTIEDISKIANWRPDGGAPPTPRNMANPRRGSNITQPPPPRNPSTPRLKPTQEFVPSPTPKPKKPDFDDDIPF